VSATEINLSGKVVNMAIMDRPQIIELKANVEYSIATMKKAIQDYKDKKSRREDVNREWYKSVKIALDIYIKNLGIINAHLSHLKDLRHDEDLKRNEYKEKAKADGQPFSFYFLECAKQFMDRSDFEYIERLAEVYMENDRPMKKRHSPAVPVTDQSL
jgi:hypothetical protein